MNSLRTWFVLLALVLGFAGTGPLAEAQSEKSTGDSTQAASATASKAEVEQLRQELAAQRRTIEQLKNLVEQLAEVKSRAPAPAPEAHLINANLPLPATPAEAEAEAPPAPSPNASFNQPNPASPGAPRRGRV